MQDKAKTAIYMASRTCVHDQAVYHVHGEHSAMPFGHTLHARRNPMAEPLNINICAHTNACMHNPDLT